MKFFTDNKVFLLGLLASVSVAIQAFVGQPEIEWKAVGFAVLMAVLSFVSNTWRGQGVTLLGIIGTLAGVFIQLHQNGTLSWNQFIISAIAAVLAAVAPPAKPASYETNPVIEKAKE